MWTFLGLSSVVQTIGEERKMPQGRVGSVARAVRLLRVFLEPPHCYSVTELSKATGYTKSLTFRLLQTLISEEMVIKDPISKTYSLGYGLIELGAIAGRTSTLVRLADPILDALAEETGETINLVVRTDDVSATCIAQRESRNLVQVMGRIGTRYDLHAGATAKVLLAFAPQDVIETYIATRSPLKKLTPNTITDPNELRAELERIRRRGYSISDREFDMHSWGVAAPVYGADGVVQSGISVAAPISRVDDKLRQHCIDAVLRWASELSKRLSAAQHFTSGPGLHLSRSVR